MDSATPRSILVVDDDEHLLRSLQDLLLFKGFDVETATSGEEALERLAEMTPDLIVLDIGMDGMGGLGFLKRITTPDGTTEHPVLVLTARSGMQQFFGSVAVDGFLAKPCEAATLEREVIRITDLYRRRREVEANGGQRTVLLAEPDAAMANTLTIPLTLAGYAVECVGNGPDLLETAPRLRPDVIVVNELLPGINGSSVAPVLSVMPSVRTTPILLYGTGRSTTERVKGKPKLPIGVHGYLTSVDGPELLQAMQQVLA